MKSENALMNPSQTMNSWGGNFIEDEIFDQSPVLESKAVVFQSVGVLFLQLAANTHGI
jgi:hypothetical protein